MVKHRPPEGPEPPTTDDIPPDGPPPPTLRGDDYYWEPTDALLYKVARGRGGDVQIANFCPQIIEDNEVDQGDDDTDNADRVWLVQLLGQGHGRTIILSSADFRGSQSLEHALRRKCPSSYYVFPGMHGHFLAAAQQLSRPSTRHVYAHTGWVEQGEQLLYLLPSAVGGIGASGMDFTTRIDRRRLPAGATVTSDNLIAYGKGLRPPMTDAENRAALTALIKLLRCGPAPVTVPVVLAVLAGPLTSAGVGEVPPLVHIMGRTGTLKTSYSLAALSLFGTFTDTTPAPAAWSWTANALQSICYTLKDLTILIDDYKRSVVKRADVARLVQNYADRTGRGRATRGGGQDIGIVKGPRGVILSNGEDRWEAEASAAARTITVHVKAGDVDLDRLTEVQQLINAGHLQLFGGGYLQWLAGQPLLQGTVVADHRERWRAMLAGRSSQTTHLRLLASFASLLAVASVVETFITDRWGARAGALFMRIVDEAVDSLFAGVREAAQEIEDDSPFRQLAQSINEGMLGGTACLASAKDNRRYPDRPRADVVGYYDPDDTGKPEFVFLTRNTTWRWFEKQAHSAGQDVTFGWQSVMREAQDDHQGVHIWRKRVTQGNRRPQLTGLLLPYSSLEEVTEVTDVTGE